MPDAKAINAAAACLDALKSLIEALGVGCTFLLAAVLVGGAALLLHLRAKHRDKGWTAALDAKDQMIAQINEQNRELRVQLLVIGKQFTREEAVKLVYRPDSQEGVSGKGKIS